MGGGINWSGVAQGLGQVIGAGGGSKATPHKVSLIRNKQSGDDSGQDSTSGGPGVPSAKRGAKVRKSGLFKLHKGERVLTAKQTRKYDKRKKGRK
jgi:hypothetical protein